MSEANVAVLIDYENVGLDSIQHLLDQLSDVGRAIVKRAYADWSVERGKRDQLLELGIEPIHIFRSTKSGKNASDIRLAIDAVDVLYGATVDTFVIVSSDSDFVPLISKLRAAGKSVIGAGRRDATSPTLVRSCDRYIYLDDAKVPGGGSPKRAPSQEAQAPSLVVRALEASVDDHGQVVGSKLYQTMQRIDPSFNFRALGHRTFALFLASRTDVRVSRPRDASDVIVQLNHPREIEAEASNAEASNEVTLPPNWEQAIDAAWGMRKHARLSGQAAAADAAKVLGVPGLGASRFPSLDKLLDASPLLRANWHREGNAIFKR